MKYYMFYKNLKELRELSLQEYVEELDADNAEDCLLRYHPGTDTILTEDNIDGYWFHAEGNGLSDIVHSHWQHALVYFETMDLLCKLQSMNYEGSMMVEEGRVTRTSFYDWKSQYMNY